MAILHDVKTETLLAVATHGLFAFARRTGSELRLHSFQSIVADAGLTQQFNGILHGFLRCERLLANPTMLQAERRFDVQIGFIGHRQLEVIGQANGFGGANLFAAPAENAATNE